MKSDKPVTVFRKDYTVFDYLVERLTLNFQIFDQKTIVTARGGYRRNPLSVRENPPLLLFGEDLELLRISIDEKELSAIDYLVDDKTLRVENPPEAFILEIVTAIYPDNNTLLEGLYRSSGNYCTQCEAEGFRRITYYPDRPDVLSRFTTRIEADRTTCPMLLANGNLIAQGELEGNRHYAVWDDPYPKPCYLFALVAGRLTAIEDEFVTRSGRRIELKIFVEERNRSKCDHAMISLKKAMRWDEEVYGLEYDLDIFMIVAVDDFNMGAMENKGLNIFNSKCVLCTPETATDEDFLSIEGVIAHEYFHNWTGNRVTCRDWFQLSLKEGLTVYRDQEFSADMNSRPVQRIDDVRILRNFQFREDSGPMAHPVRPDSYLEINNFYTATVYNKGAEVIRMMSTILGPANFRKGMDLYFARHDGQAVTCDDFAAAMSDASGIDLGQFKNWYSQAGTPLLQVRGEWNEKNSEYKLHVQQSCPDTPGQKEKQPFHIPLAVGLLGTDGQDLLMDERQGTAVLHLREKEQIFTFNNVKEKPVVSFLRDFSAPVRVASFQSRKDLAFLMRHDTNLFNRWDAATRLAGEVILETAAKLARNDEPALNELYLDAVSHNLDLGQNSEDPAILAMCLTLPAETTLAQEMTVIDPDALHRARQLVKTELATRNRHAFLTLYELNEGEGVYNITPREIGKRSLKNLSLSYLMALDPLPDEVLSRCSAQYRQATNMTDTIAALARLADLDLSVRREALDDFYNRWAGDPLVLDKWFTLQAMSSLPDTLEEVKKLLDNPSFSIKNPNKVRALIGAFCTGNHVRFHDGSGAGYSFLADMILRLNGINPQIAARLVTPLINWQKYDPKRQELMKEQLARIASTQDLSRDVFEIVSKSR